MNRDVFCMSMPLANLTVLVTRPAAQAKQLCRLLEQQGACSIAFPAIEINSLSDNVEKFNQINQIKSLTQYDLAIFISSNAVKFGLLSISEQLGDWPAQVKIAAIGSSTAKALQRNGLTVDLVPVGDFTSESFLRHKSLQRLESRKILIIRGVGGRAYLAEELLRRGANVDYLEVYQRTKPSHFNLDFIADWNANESVIVCTSKEGIRNFMSMTMGHLNFMNLRLLVISLRLQAFAKEQGFAYPILLANNGNDESIIQTLIKYVELRG